MFKGKEDVWSIETIGRKVVLTCIIALSMHVLLTYFSIEKDFSLFGLVFLPGIMLGRGVCIVSVCFGIVQIWAQNLDLPPFSCVSEDKFNYFDLQFSPL